MTIEQLCALRARELGEADFEVPRCGTPLASLDALEDATEKPADRELPSIRQAREQLHDSQQCPCGPVARSPESGERQVSCAVRAGFGRWAHGVCRAEA